MFIVDTWRIVDLVAGIQRLFLNMTTHLKQWFLGVAVITPVASLSDANEVLHEGVEPTIFGT